MKTRYWWELVGGISLPDQDSEGQNVTAEIYLYAKDFSYLMIFIISLVTTSYF